VPASVASHSGHGPCIEHLFEPLFTEIAGMKRRRACQARRPTPISTGTVVSMKMLRTMGASGKSTGLDWFMKNCMAALTNRGRLSMATTLVTAVRAIDNATSPRARCVSSPDGPQQALADAAQRKNRPPARVGLCIGTGYRALVPQAKIAAGAVHKKCCSGGFKPATVVKVALTGPALPWRGHQLC